MTISMTAAARAQAPSTTASANKAASGARHLASGAAHGRSVALAARVSLTSVRCPAARRRAKLQICAAGLPPDLAGMMGNMDPEKLKEVQAAYAKAMKDPVGLGRICSTRPQTLCKPPPPPAPPRVPPPRTPPPRTAA